MDQVKFVECSQKIEEIWYVETDHITLSFLKAVFHRFFDPFLNTLSHITPLMSIILLLSDSNTFAAALVH